MVSTLSRGPVAPSDKIGLADAALILRSCAADGKLLRPDRPAVQIDAVLMSKAELLPSNPIGEIWATSVQISSSLPHHTILLSVDASPIRIHATTLGYDAGVHVVGWSDASPLRVLDVTRHATEIPASSRKNFMLWHFAPVLPNGWTFMGEARTKWVPVSQDRVKTVQITPSSAAYILTGPMGEELDILAANSSHYVHSIKCVVGSSGQVVVRLPELTCG